LSFNSFLSKNVDKIIKFILVFEFFGSHVAMSSFEIDRWFFENLPGRK
jgi:hypothetical protein